MYEKQILNLIKKEAPLNPLAYVQDIVRDYALENLQQVMLACRETNEDDYRTTFYGNPKADILILNDRPRERGSIYSLQETEELEMVSKVFNHFGYDPADLFFIDAVNCLTYKDIGGEKLIRTPSKEEVLSSKVFVDHAIDIVRPKAILLLGPMASGVYQSKAFSEVKGSWIEAKGVPAIATYHPERLLNRDGRLHEDDIADMKEEFITHIEMLINSLNG